MPPGPTMLDKIREQQEALFLMFVVRRGGHLSEPSQQTNYDALQRLLQLMLLKTESSEILLTVLIIGLCILLCVYQLNTGITSICNKVFLVLDFIVHFSHYMFRPRLAAIFRRFANTENIPGSHYIFNGSVK
jgi:hypothetical protein